MLVESPYLANWSVLKDFRNMLLNASPIALNSILIKHTITREKKTTQSQANLLINNFLTGHGKVGDKSCSKC